MAMALEGTTIFVTLLVIRILASHAECHRRPTVVEASLQLRERHEQWMARHGRVYESNADKEERLKIFKENLEYIRNFNKGNQTFKLSINRFADLTNEEFVRSHTGGLKVSTRTRSSEVESSIYDATLISTGGAPPPSIDWRQKGAVTSVRQQGRCGSCWAHATVAAIEGLTKIKTGRLPLLSEQQLVDCVTDGPNTQGCRWGNQNDAFAYIIQNGGITSESNYPYTAKDRYCDANRASQYAAKIHGYVVVPANNEKALMNAVAQQPVVAFVRSSSKEFQFYSGGIFSGNCGSELDHLVTIVGYGTSPDGQDYWLMKNSWSANWGENGYMRLERNSGIREGRCGIAADASYPTA